MRQLAGQSVATGCPRGLSAWALTMKRARCAWRRHTSLFARDRGWSGMEKRSGWVRASPKTFRRGFLQPGEDQRIGSKPSTIVRTAMTRMPNTPMCTPVANHALIVAKWH